MNGTYTQAKTVAATLRVTSVRPRSTRYQAKAARMLTSSPNDSAAGPSR
jgi:hypothetical protein